jgi:DNA-binding MarR family transcriptional regulator
VLSFDPILEAKRHWQRQWGDKLAPEMAAVTSIMRAQQLILGELNNVLRPFGLTFSRYEALMLLNFSADRSLAMGKMGERLQVHPASVTNIIDRLEASGFVERIPHASDRRATKAQLTPLGRKTAESATAALQRDFTVPGLSQEDLDQLTVVIRQLRRACGDFAADSESQDSATAPVAQP